MSGSAQVITVRGPIAAGKTSVVEAIGAILYRQGVQVAVVPVDWLRQMVAGSQPENQEHQVVAARQSGVLASSFVASGFTAIIDGTLDLPESLDAVLGELHALRVQVFTLLPPWSELWSRHQSRPIAHQADADRVRTVYDRVAGGRDAAQGTLLESASRSSQELASNIAAASGFLGEPQTVVGS